MKKQIKLIVFALFIILFAKQMVLAEPVLDQYQTNDTAARGFWSDLMQAQTFMPSITGYLDSVELGTYIYYYSQYYPDIMHFQIAEWNGSQPGTILGQVDITVNPQAPGGVREIYSLDYSAQNILLTADTMYSIVMSNDLIYGANPPYTSAYRHTSVTAQSSGNAYSRGALWTKNTTWSERIGTDAVFKTYMTASVVPEPISSTLFIVGTATLGFRCFRKRNK